MKRLFLFATAILFLLVHVNAQNNGNMKQVSNKTKGKGMNEKTMLPYKARFTKFEIGDARYSVMVLKAWKDWDNNTLENSNNMFADTITAFLPDGQVVKGKDAFIKGGQDYRSGFKAVKSEVIAYTTLNNLDEGKNPVVMIWGRETDTKADGTSQTTELHEIWGFNKDGKVDFYRQYAAPAPKDMK